ncbi:MAG: TolC family protein, partial [Ignavibacteria bacterium]|nr:TolC family protein [Ignavibacteria bacterium]
ETLGDTEILINKIVEDHVALRQLNINKKINLELLSIDKASYLPKLYLFGQYSLSSNENDNKTFLVKYYFNNAVSVGLGLSWDLNFLKTSYKKDQSEIEVKKTDEKISDVKSKLKIQSQSVILRIKDAVNRIKSANEAILLSQKGLDLAKISYREGVIKQIDVLDSELQLNRTRLSLVKAQYDYVIARTDLEALIFN